MATRLSQYRTVAPALFDQRAVPRHSVLVGRAKINRRGSPAVEGMLHDVSIYGCRLACIASHGPGARIWLRIAGNLPIAAIVAWNDGAHIGCRFDAPLDRKVMRALTLTGG
ncbi:PilZ domain-containing protein [Sphingomonas sp.]|jgi:hypothetical protein|uniref:PilZ domain-containing protein n=1 Tax=Sphingomonas sp. TaxID=28214 RepID=UPI002ED8FCF4